MSDSVLHRKQKYLKTLLLVLATLITLVPMGCDALIGAGPSCIGETYDASTGCSQALQGIPPFPPPPCWNEAGEIRSDEVCARVYEDRPGDGEGEKAEYIDEGTLPGPPELPE